MPRARTILWWAAGVFFFVIIALALFVFVRSRETPPTCGPDKICPECDCPLSTSVDCPVCESTTTVKECPVCDKPTVKECPVFDCSTCEPTVTECPVCDPPPTVDPNSAEGVYSHLADTATLRVSKYVGPEARAEMCETLSQNFGVYRAGEFEGVPPRKPPKHMEKAFYLNGHMSGIDTPWYIDEEVRIPVDTLQTWDEARINHFIESARTDPNFSLNKWNGHFLAAIKAFPPSGVCAGVGTVNPRAEMLMLAHGATETWTMDFNPVDMTHPQMKMVTMDQWKALGEDQPLFDCAASVSSLEHDGLGRYRDPLNPWGDMWSMTRLRCMMKVGALLYLCVPTAGDALQFNALRMYGPLRWALMARGWSILGTFGFGKDMTKLTTGGRDDLNPCMVLRNEDFTLNEYSDFLLIKDIVENPE